LLDESRSGRQPLLFLFADTGGGHRSAARAVAEALEYAYPGRFDPVLVDPLSGPQASPWLRRLVRLYGPVIRLAPWLWGAIYHASDSRPAAALLRRSLLRLADRPVVDARRRLEPAAIISFHALTAAAAVTAARSGPHDIPVVTVVTDLVTTHAAWRHPGVDRIVVPSAAIGWRCHLDGIPRQQFVDVGLPVGAAFCRGAVSPQGRRSVRQSLGIAERSFVVVITGGGEGSGGMAKRAAALVRAFDDVQVVAICGRNERLQRRLRRLGGKSQGRLVVKGFVDNMADWLRCADVVVTKAGPATIAEATSCGAPIVVTSYVPGQEKGNGELVVAARAGRSAPTIKQLIRVIGELREQPALLEAMRQASVGVSRPGAAASVARLVAGMAEMPSRTWSDMQLTAQAEEATNASLLPANTGRCDGVA
jgi:1,2-diacylglycerol 3-beta-galactosyltransferase